MFYRDERLALFIDGSNLYAAAKALGFDIDYKLLRSEFMRRGKMVRAFYYTALIESEEYSPIRPLVDWLEYNGFALVTKPAKEFIDSSGRRKIKGNMDVDLAVDAMEIGALCGSSVGRERCRPRTLFRNDVWDGTNVCPCKGPTNPAYRAIGGIQWFGSELLLNSRPGSTGALCCGGTPKRRRQAHGVTVLLPRQVAPGRGWEIRQKRPQGRF